MLTILPTFGLRREISMATRAEITRNIEQLKEEKQKPLSLNGKVLIGFFILFLVAGLACSAPFLGVLAWPVFIISLVIAMVYAFTNKIDNLVKMIRDFFIDREITQLTKALVALETP